MKKFLISLSMMAVLLSQAQHSQAQQVPPYKTSNASQTLTDNAKWIIDFFALPHRTGFPAYVPDSLKDRALHVDRATHKLQSYNTVSGVWEDVTPNPTLTTRRFKGLGTSGSKFDIAIGDSSATLTNNRVMGLNDNGDIVLLPLKYADHLWQPDSALYGPRTGRNVLIKNGTINANSTMGSGALGAHELNFRTSSGDTAYTYRVGTTVDSVKGHPVVYMSDRAHDINGHVYSLSNTHSSFTIGPDYVSTIGGDADTTTSFSVSKYGVNMSSDWIFYHTGIVASNYGIFLDSHLGGGTGSYLHMAQAGAIHVYDDQNQGIIYDFNDWSVLTDNSLVPKKYMNDAIGAALGGGSFTSHNADSLGHHPAVYYYAASNPSGYINTTGGDARYPQLTLAYDDPSWLNTIAYSKVTGRPTPVANETPSGSVNGSNVNFTLAFNPLSGTLVISRNGLVQVAGTDYTQSGTAITYLFAPATGDILKANYSK